MRLSRRLLIAAVVGSLFWWMILNWLGTSYATIDPRWRDHVSNVFCGYLLKERGYEVYSRPTMDFVTLPDLEKAKAFAEEQGLPNKDVVVYDDEGVSRMMVIITGQVPRPYPPGYYLYHAPATALVVGGVATSSQVLNWFALVALLVAHVSALFVVRSLMELKLAQGTRKESLAGGLLLGLASTFCYFEFIRWTLNGEYDLLAVLFLVFSIMAYRESRPTSAIAQFAVSCFIHFRSLTYFPIVVFSARDWFEKVRVGKATKKDYALLVFSAALAIPSAYALWLNIPALKDASMYDLNALHFSKLGPGNWGKTLALFVGGGAILVTLGMRGQLLTAACAAWSVLMFMQSRVVREWYANFFYPLFMLLDDRGSRKNRGNVALVLAWIVLVSALLTSNSPFEFRLIRELVEAFGRR